MYSIYLRNILINLSFDIRSFAFVLCDGVFVGVRCSFVEGGGLHVFIPLLPVSSTVPFLVPTRDIQSGDRDGEEQPSLVGLPARRVVSGYWEVASVARDRLVRGSHSRPNVVSILFFGRPREGWVYLSNGPSKVSPFQSPLCPPGHTGRG